MMLERGFDIITFSHPSSPSDSRLSGNENEVMPAFNSLFFWQVFYWIRVCHMVHHTVCHMLHGIEKVQIPSLEVG